jgi:hypothetical protein
MLYVERKWEAQLEWSQDIIIIIIVIIIIIMLYVVINLVYNFWQV